MSDGSPLDNPIQAPMMIGPGPTIYPKYEIPAPRFETLKITPWPTPPDPLDLIRAKLDSIEDAMMQILDFLTKPTAIVEPAHKPLLEVLSIPQRSYLRAWVQGDTLEEIADAWSVSRSSVQRTLTAVAKKLGYLSTAELRNAVTSGKLQLE